MLRFNSAKAGEFSHAPTAEQHVSNNCGRARYVHIPLGRWHLGHTLDTPSNWEGLCLPGLRPEPADTHMQDTYIRPHVIIKGVIQQEVCMCVCICLWDQKACYRETGWMGDLCTVGTLHQGERRVSGFFLVGFFADFAHRRKRKPRLWRPADSHTHTHRRAGGKTRRRADLRKGTGAARRSASVSPDPRTFSCPCRSCTRRTPASCRPRSAYTCRKRARRSDTDQRWWLWKHNCGDRESQ